MRKQKIIVSIVIVHYHVPQELFRCLTSIINLETKTPYEILIIDNDDKPYIEKKLATLFPKAAYYKSQKNNGFSAGNNIGASYAQGEYLFFLNPDTILLEKTIDALVDFLDTHKNVAIAAPLLIQKNNKPFTVQGTGTLGVKEGIFSLSFINKLFPQNPISTNFWKLEWNQKDVRSVDTVPGAAIFIRKKIFEKIGGFDEKFFLFFEEFDLCYRVKKLGYSLYIVPYAKIIHTEAASTKKSSHNIKRIFQKSRMLYFKKNYGFFAACIVEAVNRINPYVFALFLIVGIGAFLRFDRLATFMPFIGDQGWFYLSAKDMIVNGEIPLVGIPSSRPWLHQGAFWTYLLSGALWLFNFHPVAGGYLTAFIGLLTILAMYFVGFSLFSKRVGLIASFLYATAPLIVMQDRMAYHTSPIPLFTVALFYCLCKWIQGRSLYFSLSLILLAVLYNFEIATATLWFIVFILFGYGIYKKTLWVKMLWKRNIIFSSIISIFVVMLPMLLYDISHGFPQTGKFLLWIPYRIILFFTISTPHGISVDKVKEMFLYFLFHTKQLLFIGNSLVASLLFLVSACYLLVLVLRFWKNKNQIAYVILALFFFIPLIGIFLNLTPSGAYLPMLFPGVILTVSLFFSRVVSERKFTVIACAFIIVLTFYNSYVLVTQNFFTQRKFALEGRIHAANKIINVAKNREYTLVGRGPGSEFESYIMNYTYLTWWLGNEPSTKQQDIQIVIKETPNAIIVEKNK